MATTGEGSAPGSGAARDGKPDGRHVVLLDDHFAALDVGPLSVPVGAHTEYHFLPEAAPKGGWTVACFRPGSSQGAWHVVQDGGQRAIAQTITNTDRGFHPLLVAGDPLWRDYRLDVTFVPEGRQPACGVVFRYRNNRCYCFFGFRDGHLALTRVRHEETTILRLQPCEWQAGREGRASVTVQGNHIRAEMAGVGVLEADDDAYPAGPVGLLADGPTRFRHVLVTTTPEEGRCLRRAVESRGREIDALQSANPLPVVWKQISTEGFGVGRNLRFGDLTGDGRKDILIGQVVHHGPRDQYSELSCLTAMTLDGEVLWQIGTPDPAHDRLTNDVAFQIHDLDRDGRNEVIYCMHQEIVVADGATGKTKYKAPTPASKPPANRYPRILGDCLFFCDLRGRGYPQDVVIKDRYWHFWVLTDQLQPLWEASCRTGHYPFAADIDGDGHDELAMGYALFDHDGTLLWNLEDRINDHADGIAIVNFREKPGSVPRIFYAASDGGALYVDLAGNILRHHRIGHVQNPAIADFRPELPGLETVSINFWGNQGILHFLDADGNLYHDCEPNPFGSMCLPVNWTGRPGEFFVHNPNVRWGGMFDGWGRCVVPFPDDGHPDMCNAVLDLTGDCRDEIVVWDPHRLWVYTQSDNPKTGRLYCPRRNPLHNTSNYQATISQPGWTE